MRAHDRAHWSDLNVGGAGSWKLSLLAALVVLGALHVSAWADHPPDIDPVNFVAALDRYDLSRDAPHAPGYPLYVGMGRLARAIVGSAYAYQTVNLAMMLGTSVLLVFIGWRLGSRLSGIIAAVVFAAHPLVWAATVVPECYVSDAFGGAAVVASGLAVGLRRRLGLVLFVVSIFLLGMIRPTSCAFVVPAGLAAIWFSTRADERWWRWVAIGFAGAAITTAVAYVLTIQIVGGLEIYRAESDRVMGGALRFRSVLAGAPLEMHLAMVSRLVAWFALWSAPCLLAWAACFVLRRTDGWLPVTLLLLAWIIPALGFYALVYYLKPTYQVIFLPALCMGIGLAIVRIFRERLVVAVVAIAMLPIAQLAFFWLGTSAMPEQLYRLTHGFVVEKDAAWDRLEGQVRKADAETFVLVRGELELPPQAIRLMRPDGVFGLQGQDGRIAMFDNGRWLPGTDERLGRYGATLIVSDFGGRVNAFLADAPHKLQGAR